MHTLHSTRLSWEKIHHNIQLQIGPDSLGRRSTTMSSIRLDLTLSGEDPPQCPASDCTRLSGEDPPQYAASDWLFLMEKIHHNIQHQIGCLWWRRSTTISNIRLVVSDGEDPPQHQIVPDSLGRRSTTASDCTRLSREEIHHSIQHQIGPDSLGRRSTTISSIRLDPTFLGEDPPQYPASDLTRLSWEKIHHNIQHQIGPDSLGRRSTTISSIRLDPTLSGEDPPQYPASDWTRLSREKIHHNIQHQIGPNSLGRRPPQYPASVSAANTSSISWSFSPWPDMYVVCWQHTSTKLSELRHLRWSLVLYPDCPSWCSIILCYRHVTVNKINSWN